MLQWEAVWGLTWQPLSDTWHQCSPWVALQDPGDSHLQECFHGLSPFSARGKQHCFPKYLHLDKLREATWEPSSVVLELLKGTGSSHSNHKALSCICAVDLFQAEKADQGTWLFTFYHLSSFLIFKLHKAVFPLLPKSTQNLYTKPADEAGHCIPAGLEQPLPTDSPHLPLLSHCQHSGRRQSCLRGSSAQTSTSGIWIQVLLTPWGQQRTAQNSAYLYLCASSCGGSVPFSHYWGMLAEQHEFAQAEFLLSVALRGLKFGHF